MNSRNHHKLIGKNRLLIATDSLVEHGVWTPKERDIFLEKLFLKLRDNNLEFDLKIHPSSEDKLYYEQILKKLKINSSIFQKENLWEIVDNFNLVISYGATAAHTELAACEVKMVLLSISKAPLVSLVKEAISNGHVIKCEQGEDLIPSIHKLSKKDVPLTKEFVSARDKLIYNSQGRAGKLVLETIIRFTKNEN